MFPPSAPASFDTEFHTEWIMAVGQLGSDELFQLIFIVFNIIGVAVTNRLFAGIVEIIIARQTRRKVQKTENV